MKQNKKEMKYMDQKAKVGISQRWCIAAPPGPNTASSLHRLGVSASVSASLAYRFLAFEDD